MSIYHCSIKIISRSSGRSAVACAAYRAGEKLRNEETGITHDFTKKGGVIMNEILLPANAPAKYQNREKLWNDVQKIEKRADAQLAREVEVALPKEMSRLEQIRCVREYIRENFVSKGMIADWALHDKEDGNPHAHIMLTVRGFNADSSWMKKQKSVYANARFPSGKPIFNPSLPYYDPKRKEETSQYRIPQLDKYGKQKKRVRKGKGTELLWEKITLPLNDWNKKENAEVWRSSWASHCNQYLDTQHQVDHKSFKRCGIDLEPSIHEGVTARKMKSEGKQSDRIEINRQIAKRNHQLISIRQEMQKVTEELFRLVIAKARDVYERFRGIRENLIHPSKSGCYDGSFGRTVPGDQGEDSTDSKVRNTNWTIRVTDQAIKDTDQYIKHVDHIIRQKQEKEAEKDERRRSMQQRDPVFDSKRGYPGSGNESLRISTGADTGELPGGSLDIASFLRTLEDQERAAEEKRKNNVAQQRTGGCAEEKYTAPGTDRRGKEHQPKAPEKLRKRETGSRGYGFGR